MNIFKVRGKFNLPIFVLMILIPLSIGWISSALTSGTREIYQSLNQPPFAPPGWIFAPVWTTLYILMGIASYRIVMLGKEGIDIILPYRLYLIQLFFNFIWTLIFFRWALRGWAFVELILLLTLIIITTALFFRKDKTAGWLMIPYNLWVIFAGVLNFSVWWLNR